MQSNRQQIAIMQQQSAVDMLRTLVKNRRATPNDLEQAERRLAELKELDKAEDDLDRFKKFSTPVDFKTEVLNLRPTTPQPTPEQLAAPEVMTIGRNLMRQIDELKEQIAEISNKMHLVPEDVPCPELMKEAVSLKKEEEAIWTKYYFLQKNGHLPEVPEEESEMRSVELLDAIDKKKRLVDRRHKLKSKIDNPANTRNKKLELWKDQLTQADLDYQYYDDLIRILKDR